MVLVQAVADKAGVRDGAMVGLPMHQVASDKRISFLLKKLIEDFEVHDGMVPPHVLESLHGILAAAAQSAFDAQSWDTAHDLATKLRRFLALPCWLKQQAAQSQQPEELTRLLRVLALSALGNSRVTEAYEYAVQAARRSSHVSSWTLVLKVLSRCFIPLTQAENTELWSMLSAVNGSLSNAATDEQMDERAPTTCNGFLKSVRTAFARLLTAEGFQAFHLALVIDDFLADLQSLSATEPVNMADITTTGSASTSVGASPMKLAAAAWAIRQLLDSNSTHNVPQLELVKALITIEKELYQLKRGVRKDLHENIDADAVAHSAFVLRLLFCCLRELHGGKRMSSKSVEWCLREAWNTALIFRAANASVQLLAAAAAVDTLAGALVGSVDAPTEAEILEDDAEKIPKPSQNIILATTLCGSRLLQISSHLLLGGTNTQVKAASAAASLESFPAVSQVGLAAFGPDPFSKLAHLTQQQHLQAAMSHVNVCRDLLQQVQDAERHAQATNGDGSTLALLASATASTSLLHSVASSAADLIRHSTGAAANGTTPSFADVKAMLLVAEITAKAISSQTDATKGARTAALERLLQQLRAEQSVTSEMLAYAADCIRAPPCLDLPTSLTALSMAVEVEMNHVFGKTASATTATADVRCVCRLLRSMLQVVPSRAETIPVLERIKTLLTSFLQRLPSGNATAPATGSDGGGGSAFELFFDPLVALADYATCLAWNQGVYFFNLSALERAERFMSFALNGLLPLLSQLTARTAAVTNDAGVLDTSGFAALITTDLASLMSQDSMRSQYAKVQQLLDSKQHKYGSLLANGTFPLPSLALPAPPSPAQPEPHEPQQLRSSVQEYAVVVQATHAGAELPEDKGSSAHTAMEDEAVQQKSSKRRRVATDDERAAADAGAAAQVHGSAVSEQAAPSAIGLADTSDVDLQTSGASSGMDLSAVLGAESMRE